MALKIFLIVIVRTYLASGNVTEARQILKIYYDVRKNAPELFDDRDPMLPHTQQCFKRQMDLQYDLVEAMERQRLSQKDLDQLRTPPVPGVPSTITDKQLALFLNACGNVAKARKGLEIYYDSRKCAPELFDERDPFLSHLRQCFDCQINFYLPVTPQGLSVIYHRLCDPKPSNYHFDNAIKIHLMTIDACLSAHGPNRGLILIFDMRDFKLGHLPKMNMRTLFKLSRYFQDGLPANLNAIHIINVKPYIDKCMMLIKPLARAEIFQMFHFHKSDLDWEDFYKEYIPKSSLPSDYGGDCPSVEEMRHSFVKELEQNKGFYNWEEKQRTTDDKRAVEKKSYKKLEID